MIKLGVEIVLISIAILLSVFQKIEWYDSAIISMLSFIVVELIAQKIRHDSLFCGVNSSISDVNYELKSIANNVQLKHIHDDLKSNMNRVKHPYFTKLLSYKLEKFIHDNSSLFNEDHSTSPFNADTYGAEGLRNTKDNIKCVSSFDDFWADRGNSDYYDYQLELLSKGVRIQRLFVVNSSNKKSAKKEMKRQKSDGIEVRSIDQYIFGEEGFFRDYLIQDNNLLVDLIPHDPVNPKHGDSSEKISTNNLGERIEEFNKYWTHATNA